MTAIYDSGWVPQASGSVVAGVQTNDLQAMIIVATSGANAATNVGGKWNVGNSVVTPAWRGAATYNCSPLPGGNLALTSSVLANTTLFYQLGGVSSSMATYLGGYVYPYLTISGTAGANSFFRVIVG